MTQEAPGWLTALAATAGALPAHSFSRFLPPPDGGRPSAVLILFGDGPGGTDVLLLQRAAGLRAHAGQPAFPGGAQDAGDDGPVGAALREAAEETGLDPSGVQVLATLPELYLPVSGFVVTAVLGWWHRPGPVSAVDPTETAAVVRIPVSELADRRNRVLVRRGPYLGPGFRVGGMLVWGFTAGLLQRLLELAGLIEAANGLPVLDAPTEPAPTTVEP